MPWNKAGRWAACFLLIVAGCAKLSAAGATALALVTDSEGFAFGNLNLISGVFTPINEDLSVVDLSTLGVYNGTLVHE